LLICINDGGGTGFVGFGSEGEIPGGDCSEVIKREPWTILAKRPET
jgi:hypothetical protein